MSGPLTSPATAELLGKREPSQRPQPAGLAGSPRRKGNSAMSDASMIIGAAYAAQALTFFAGIIQKGLLGPVGAGFWALMQSFWQLSKIAQIGAFDGASRQIPFHRGREDYESAAASADTGFTFSLVAMTVLGALLATFALAFGEGWAPEMRYGLVLLGVTGPLRLLADIHLALLHATRRFRTASAATILVAALGLTVQTVLVALYGFYGMFLGTAVASLGALALYVRLGLTGRRRPAFTWRIDRSHMRELVAYGFPFMVFSQIWLLFAGIDSLIIAGFIDVENLGYYALAVSVTTYILHMPKSIGQALFPRMAERYGQTGEVSSLARYATDAQQLLAFVLVPAFVAGAFYLFPVLIRHALPEFEPAIAVVHIMAAGSFVLALCNLPIKAMLTAGRRRALILLVTVCLGINAAANYVAVAVLDRGIEGAAVATVLSYFVVFVATSGYALTMMLGRRVMVRHVTQLIVVAVYVAAGLWAIEALIGSGAGPLLSDALTAVAKLALFAVLLTPWLFVAERSVQGVSRLRDAGLAVVRRIGRQ